jgi:superfamily II DNA or RNA helicase
MINKYTLKPYQKDALYNVFNHKYGLNKNDRTQMIMACGTGKTFVSLKIAEKSIEKLDSSITVMLFPSLYLIDQTKKEWEEQTYIESFKNPLVICSDESIGLNEQNDIFEIDKIEVAYKVTTNYELIIKYLDKNRGHMLIFSTYHSSHILGKALKNLHLKADLTLFDEAHKTAIANSTQNNSLAFALDNKLFPSNKRLFMTATAKYYVVNKTLETQIAYSMDNEKLYGRVSFEYSLREAIDNKQITDYKILGILIDNEYIEKFKKLNLKITDMTSYNEHNKLKSELKAAKLKAIDETMKKYKIKSGLSFHTTIEESKFFAQEQMNSNIDVVHLDGTTNHQERYQAINNLGDKSNYIVSNSRLLTEGVNMPEIGMVFLDKTIKSIVDITQIVGRVQRISKINPNKIGYIMLPLFINDINNIDVEMERNGELKNLFDILNSFRQVDYQLREQIALKKYNNKDKSNDNAITLPLEIVSLNGANSIDFDVEHFENKVKTVILNTRTVLPKQNYIDATMDFISKYGLLELKSKTVYKGLKIGEFRAEQRKKYKKLKTKKEQKAMRNEFNNIHKDYLAHIDDVLRNVYIDATCQYIKEYGYKSMRSTTIYNNISIGEYRSTQRKKYKKLKTDQEKQKMQNIFNVIHKDYLFNGIYISRRNHIEATIDYISKFGYEKLNSNTKHNGYNIGIFRANQRKKYRNSKDDLEKEELKKELMAIHKDYLIPKV